MSGPVLEFEKVGKLYRLGTVGTGTLTRDLNRWWKIHVKKEPDPYLRIGESNDRNCRGNSDVVWALRDISFAVNKGDVVGIIGKNGAGKSTLLKLLSRITAPTVGTIRARGRVASLLEIGTGFHQELTGRENVYMNGTVMGMSRGEIDKKIDEIVSFAGIERYIDTPVKRFSSGMTVRLGFAVAAFLEPEILVVDEVLAVGDAEFQRKAVGKMQDISTGEGRTVLFVSHNMASVKALCTKGVLLDKGEVSYIGDSEDTVRHYLSGQEVSGNKLIKDEIRYKKSWLTIDRIELNGTEYNRSVIKSGQRYLPLVIEGQSEEDFRTDPMVIFRNRDGVALAALADGHIKGRIEHIVRGKFRIERLIELPEFMSEGDYLIEINLHHPMTEWQMRIPNAVELHAEGFYEGLGHASRLSEEGFFALHAK